MIQTNEDYSFAAEFDALIAEIAEIQEEIDSASKIAKDMMWEQNILYLIARTSGYWDDYQVHHEALGFFLTFKSELVTAHARMVAEFALYLEAATLPADAARTLH